MSLLTHTHTHTHTHTRVYINRIRLRNKTIYKKYPCKAKLRGARGVMVIVEGNGHGYASSNPERY